jgi:predicted ATPase
LFLDELDKCKATEFQVARLAELVDEVYAQEGQVVATSNKDFDSLCGKWGDDEAGTILRRIGAGPGAHSVEFAG